MDKAPSLELGDRALPYANMARRCSIILKTNVLRILLDSDSYVSGQKMCSDFGVTRSAVWKAIESLRGEGFSIESRTNQGYKLKSIPDVLTEETIRPYVSVDKLGREIICLNNVDSTNNYLKKLAAEGAPEGIVVIADCQVSGRGRIGRSFWSPPGKGVYLSVLLRPKFEPSQLIGITSMTAIAICEAIEAASGIEAGIKWVNDIIAGEKKICGILTEMSIESESGQVQYMVVGMGVNVHHSREDFPDEVLGKATSLAMLGADGVSRPRLAAEMINSMNNIFDTLPNPGEKLWEKYRQRSVTIGRQVKIIKGDTERDAFAEDIKAGGELIVRYPDGTRSTLTHGEVSVRGKYGYV